MTSFLQPVDIISDKSVPKLSCLNQNEEEVGQEEHEGVVEHDRVEKCLARQDQVDDVGDEEADDGDAQHDGVDDAENVF